MAMSQKSKFTDISKDIDEKCKEVWNFLRVVDTPQKADVIFILGEPSIAPVYKAIELWKQGLAPIISFVSYGGTYGIMKEWGMSEAEKYKKELIRGGVPDDALVFESKTTNTLEEAKEASRFLRNKGISPRRVILVAIPAHQRRVYATFHKQNPRINFINCPAEIPFISGNKKTIERLVGEIERLEEYGKKGDLEEQDIPKNILEAVDIINKYLS